MRGTTSDDGSTVEPDEDLTFPIPNTALSLRHTVAYRLERVKELTGLDPMQSEDRERLGLGLKAYRIIAPRLHR